MAHVNLDRLHPVFRQYVEQILSDLRSRGWQPIVASAVRTEAEQADKVKQGYSKTKNSWHVASTAASLWETKNSYSVVHGNAVDIVDKRYGWEGKAANTQFKFWSDLGAAAKARGCVWGGDWKTFKDVAHVEWHYIDSPARTTALV
jgi:hypothetical protein